MARFVDEPENIYRFDIEEKYVGSVAICADSFEEALIFLKEQYRLRNLTLQPYPTSFIDDKGNKYLY